MKRFFPAILILLIFSTTAYSQESFSKKFGTVDRSDFELKQNPQYKGAPAVVLDDLGKSQFFIDQRGTTIVFNRKTKIRIFTDAGKSYAKVEIPYQISDPISELVYNIEGITFTHENGKIVRTRLKSGDIHTKRLSPTRYVVEFVLPDVKKGSVIEYRYTFKTNSPYDLPSWNFQWTIPVRYSDYEVRMIPFYKYTWELQGPKQLDYNSTHVDRSVPRSYEGTTFYDNVHDFAMDDVPAFKDTAYIPTMNDYCSRVNFQLSVMFYPTGGSEKIITSWSNLIEKLLKADDFGKYLKKSAKLSAKLMDLKKLKNEPPDARLNAVLNYVKSHFKWDGDLSRVASQKPERLISRKSGNSADINLLAVSMLKQAGIDADPLLISTRNHGIIQGNYPYLHFFNDVIILARINGKQVLTDATEPNCLNNRLPLRCINDKGLVVDKGKVDWVLLNKTPLSQTMTKNKIAFRKGNLNINVVKSATEYDALKLRNEYSGEVALKGKLESEGYQLISPVTVQNQHEKSKPYKMSYSFRVKPDTADNKIIISPFYHEIGKKNMFSQDKRTYSVDLIYPNKKLFYTTLDIPEGYTVNILPKSLNINNDQYELKYNAVRNGNQVMVSLEYYFKWSLYPVFDYQKIKFFFSRVIQKGNENIVLEKIKK